MSFLNNKINFTKIKTAITYLQNAKCTLLKKIKKHFDIGSYARKKTGMTTKNNHSANKKMAIEKIQEICPNIFNDVPISKQDDIADSLLQAIWYGDNLLGERRRKRVTSLRLKSTVHTKVLTKKRKKIKK